MRRFAKYLLALLLPLIVLLVRPLTPALVLTLGQEIRLETEPLDPRDLFRGDYVELRFAIERIPVALIKENSGDILPDESDEDYPDSPAFAFRYVTLSPDAKGIYQPVRLTLEPPSEGVYVRGRPLPYHYYWDRDFLHLDYGNGLRRFYVKENTGLALEEAARYGEVIALAKVWKGRIVLDTLLTEVK